MSNKKQVKFDELNLSQHNGARIKEEIKQEVKPEIKQNNTQYCFNIFELFCHTDKITEINDTHYK
jgi:hypothetical protein